MREFPTVTDLIGKTPVVRFPHVQPAGGARLLGKLEYMNPGGSIKDRIAGPMVDAAERDGLLKPGGTIVEPTSGNTGVGLAMVAAQRGYRCVFVMPDKMSREKIALLRAFGAEVVVCPTNVEPEDPASYYSVSNRLSEEIPGAWKPDQYSNQTNPKAHYEQTGPEIYEQLGDDLHVLVVGVGTGGTVTGLTRYLRERLPSLEVVGADPEGSIYHSPDIRPYLIEGVGEDFWPTTFDPESVDRWITVSDRDAFLAARRLAREEGVLVGGSAGMALHAAIEVCRETPPGQERARDPPRRRPAVPVEGVRRRVDDPARVPGAGRRGAVHRPGAARQDLRRDRGAGVRRGRLRPARVGGDRAAPAVRHLAAAGGAARERRHRPRRSTSAIWSARSTSATCSTTCSATTTR